MATSLNGVHLSDERLDEIKTIANDWCFSNGLVVVCKDGHEGTYTSSVGCVPITLFPSVIPRTLMDLAKSMMPHFNRLMHRVAMDHHFLEQALKNVIEVDEFTSALWNIYIQVRENGIKQPIMLGLFRSDFLINCHEGMQESLADDCLQIKQVEFNTIAAGSGGLAQRIGCLHRLSLALAGREFTSDQAPENNSYSEVASGLVKAWELYGNRKAVIVFVVSLSEKNIYDQRFLEFGVYDINPRIKILRKTLTDFGERGNLDEESHLFLDKDEVAVLYLRDGYDPSSYSSQTEWKGRLKMELSQSIKCPSIQHQLVGTKKIQQELARPGALEQFIHDEEIVKQLRACFADLYSIDLGPEGDKAVKLALDNPGKYVLKPQREGGGNNLYGEDIVNFIKEHMESKERNAYILMEKIFPWKQTNYLLKKGFPFSLKNVVPEFGTYGIYIGTSDLEEIENKESGHMLRTKWADVDEGGIFGGCGAIDSALIL